MGLLDVFTGGSAKDLVQQVASKPVAGYTAERAGGHMNVTIRYQDGTRQTAERYWDAGREIVRSSKVR